MASSTDISIEKSEEQILEQNAQNDGAKLEANTASGNAEEVDTNASPREIHGLLWFLVVIAILSSIFLYSLDNTIVADISPAVVNRFGDTVKLPWLSVGFLLGGAAVVLPFGKLYGLFDAKWLYIASSLLFNIGSALCGAAPNMNALIIGRVLAGMGGNGMYLGVMTLLSVNTSDRERPGYLSFVGLVWGVGTVLGPVVGGAFVESPATWRWAFYINLCVSGLFAPVYLFYIPSFKPRAGNRIIKLVREFDTVGMILSVGAIITIIMAINFGGTLYRWNSGQTIALFVVSVVLFIIFGIQQETTLFTNTSDRIFPAHFLRNVNAVLLYICASAVNTAGFIPIYYVPLYFQFTRGDDAIRAAVRLLPLIFVLSAAILANGHLMSRFSYFQPWYIFGSILTLIGGVLLSRIEPDTSEAKIYGFEILVGIGTGCFIQAGYAVIQAVVPPAEMAYAISFMMLAQLGGIAFGLAIAGAVFINKAIAGLAVLLPDVSRSELQLAISGTSGEYFSSLSGEIRSQSIDIIVGALRAVFIPVYVAAALSLVLSVCFTQRKLFKDAVAIAAEIRVLVLENGELDSPLRASFRTCSAEDSGLWEAVSYAWEGQAPSETIHIGQRPVKVSKVVREMLELLRYRDCERLLWIDAICINQGDEAEKSQQVALMTQIYKNASAGIIYLRTDDEKLAEKTVTAARWLDSVDKEMITELRKTPEGYDIGSIIQVFHMFHPQFRSSGSIHMLMELPWFRRVWVVQEAVLPKSVIVQIGNQSLPWDLFATVMLRFLSHGSVRRSVNLSLEECYLGSLRQSSRETNRGITMIHLILNLRNWRFSSGKFQTWPSGMALACRDLLAAVPSDKVYGLGGLFGLGASPDPADSLIIDYGLNPGEVYMQFTFWCIEQEETLDILAQQRYTNGQRRTQCDNKMNLSSWATDWTAPKVSGTDVIQPRGLVSAINEIKPCLPKQIRCRRDGRKLNVRGYIIDTVKDWMVQMEVDSLKQRFLRGWLNMITDDTRLNLLLFGVGRPTTETLEKVYEQTLAKDSSILHLWREESVSEEYLFDKKKGFRKPVLTASGYLAVTFPFFRLEDNVKVCALQGGRSLFLLQDAGHGNYKLICGDCFIDGLEDGKGVGVAQELGINEQDICIV
ncbi:hypothetical protein FQN54_003274 [Arachnomyces sp. PD_36]|nr:hypothetical protein FQN54_003274 [Arachnomyces sp. PD_36]